MGTTLKEIAKAAGLSKSAVSLALRNHPRISKATRDRVRRLADAMGYRPNPAAAALAGQRHGGRPRTVETLAWVTNWPTRDGWREASPVYNRFFQGARNRAEELGCRLEHFWLREPGMNRPRFEQVFWSRGIRGLILPPQPAPNSHINLTWSRYAAVKIGYTLVSPRLHTISPSHSYSMTLLLKKLRARGYERIGFALRSAVDARVEHAWQSAYLLDRERHPSRAPIPLLLMRGPQKRRFCSWIQTHRPDAVITAEPGLAIGLLEWCRELDLHVPRDLGIGVVSNVPLDGELSGIHEQSEQIGGTAVEVLTRMLYHNETGLPQCAVRTLIDGVWVEGKTLARGRKTGRDGSTEGRRGGRTGGRGTGASRSSSAR